MTEFASSGYMAEVDALLDRHREEFAASMEALVGVTDDRLVELGMQINPNKYWAPRKLPETAPEMTPTQIALEPFKRGSRNDERYSIPRGAFGDGPAEWQPGQFYLLKGLVSVGAPCEVIDGGYWFRNRVTGVYEFTWDAKYKLSYINGERYRYDGDSVSHCDICGDGVPYQNFTKVDEHGRPELGELGVPVGAITLDGMVGLAEVAVS